MSALTDAVREALGTETLTRIGGGSGCISSGTGYRTKEGREVFVKVNTKPEALRMFIGEEASLKAICDTNTVVCPRPVKLIESLPGGGCALIMDYLNLSSTQDGALGEQLARLHMDNWKLLDHSDTETHSSRTGVTQFGFPVETCCGYYPQKNEWRDDWVIFYCEKIDHQIQMLGGKEAKTLSVWSKLRPKVRGLFTGLVIRPSLLHGDLWAGNAGHTAAGPAVYDASSFYGHHEFDFGIAVMFGGFGAQFYKAYHKLIPEQPGQANRVKLYELFHHLNHWNLFGSGYKGSTLRIMEDLLRLLGGG